MAKDQIVSTPDTRRAAPPPSQAAWPARPRPRRAKKRTPLPQFLREVRAEARKVTWTSWKETWITSVMVGIMVVMTAIFFFGVDWILHLGIGGTAQARQRGLS